MASIELVAAAIGVALVFDFLNGANDAANSISTVVSTRVLRPRIAVAWAAFFNFIAFGIFGVKVAETIGKGIVSPAFVNEFVVLAALLSAVFWTGLSTKYGMPISVSHSLVGGLVGAAFFAVGAEAILFSGFFLVVIFIVIAPLLGMVAGFFLMALILNIIVRTKRTGPRTMKLFGRLQLVSSAIFSLGHGSNDAQKTAGIISVLLFSTGYLGSTFHVPLWVILVSYSTIAFGTLIGGWRVVRTMGMRITKLRTPHGFAAETTGGLLLFGTALAGIPVSTTHTIAGSIMGVGATRRLSAVRWGVARKIVFAWVVTIPLTALVAGGLYLVMGVVIGL